MKKITKLMSIIQVVWIYLVGVLLFNIDKVESSFQGAYFIGIVIISIIVNILTIISATAEKKEFKKLAFIEMFMKIALIPYYIFIIILALSSFVMLAITGVGILFVPLIYFLLFLMDYTLLCTTSSFGSCAMSIAKNNGILSKKAVIILNICHYIFVLDVISSIVLYFMIRKKNDTPEDVKFRKIARIVLIILLIIVIAISSFIALFQKTPNKLYLREPYTTNQIDEYISTRFINAEDVHFMTGVEEFYDENNKQCKEWNIVVNDLPCHVASIETEVYDGLTGKKPRTYYRAETDYDYVVLKNYISENYNYFSWEMYSNYNTRYDEYSVFINYINPIDGYSTYELEKIENEIKQISSVKDELLIQKEIKFKIHKNDKDIYITNDTTYQLYVDV